LVSGNLGLAAGEVWFQDETQVGQRGTVTRMWVSKGSRPRVILQQPFEAAYVFGAVCPAEGKAAALVMPKANAESMQHHLDLIAESVAPGKHGVLVADRASWHVTEKFLIPANLSILPATLLARTESSRTNMAATTAIGLGKPVLY
jgi:DDE superfamily endonuclease